MDETALGFLDLAMERFADAESTLRRGIAAMTAEDAKRFAPTYPALADLKVQIRGAVSACSVRLPKDRFPYR